MLTKAKFRRATQRVLAAARQVLERSGQHAPQLLLFTSDTIIPATLIGLDRDQLFAAVARTLENAQGLDAFILIADGWKKAIPKGADLSQYVGRLEEYEDRTEALSILAASRWGIETWEIEYDRQPGGITFSPPRYIADDRGRYMELARRIF